MKNIWIAVLGAVMGTVSADDFARCVDPVAKVRKLAGDMKFTEGPVWVPRATV